MKHHFCWKNDRSFCIAKASYIFSTKSIGLLQILTFEILTKRYLTTSLVLNDRALVLKSIDNFTS